jgi:hypothetical protein
MCSVETAPHIKAVVVGKGADFANGNTSTDDGIPLMPQVIFRGMMQCIDLDIHVKAVLGGFDSVCVCGGGGGQPVGSQRQVQCGELS